MALFNALEALDPVQTGAGLVMCVGVVVLVLLAIIPYLRRRK